LFNHLYLGALMRWLTVPGLKLEAEFAAIVSLFAAGAEAPPKQREPVPSRSGGKQPAEPTR
jgi:hypothetical protein